MRVRGSTSEGTLTIDRATIDGNQIVVPSGTGGWGIDGRDAGLSVCSNNVIIGFDTAMPGCTDAGGNTGL